MSDFDEQVPEESEQLDQLETDRTLSNAPIEDPLEQGYAPPDRWSAAEGYGNTAEEMAEGESLEDKLAQEQPDVGEEELQAEDDPDLPAEDFLDDGEVGDERAGRLVDADGGYPGEDEEPDLVGEDVGVDGAAASAEEAAVHVVEDEPR